MSGGSRFNTIRVPIITVRSVRAASEHVNIKIEELLSETNHQEALWAQHPLKQEFRRDRREERGIRKYLVWEDHA